MNRYWARLLVGTWLIAMALVLAVAPKLANRSRGTPRIPKDVSQMTPGTEAVVYDQAPVCAIDASGKGYRLSPGSRLRVASDPGDLIRSGVVVDRYPSPATRHRMVSVWLLSNSQPLTVRRSEIRPYPPELY